jgi:hypothetical protein
MPPDSHALPRAERGQTPQDYVIGILVFLATVIAIVGFFPTLTTPYQSGVSGDDIAQSDRVAQQLVTNLSTVEQPNRLNVSTLDRVMELDEGAMNRRYGLPLETNVNITVVTLDGTAYARNATGEPLTSNRVYRQGSVASSARIVRLTNSTAGCDPACRLVVRVW